jgi:hypothetical protein
MRDAIRERPPDEGRNQIEAIMECIRTHPWYRPSSPLQSVFYLMRDAIREGIRRK